LRKVEAKRKEEESDKKRSEEIIQLKQIQEKLERTKRENEDQQEKITKASFLLSAEKIKHDQLQNELYKQQLKLEEERKEFKNKQTESERKLAEEKQKLESELKMTASQKEKEIMEKNNNISIDLARQQREIDETRRIIKEELESLGEERRKFDLQKENSQLSVNLKEEQTDQKLMLLVQNYENMMTMVMTELQEQKTLNNDFQAHVRKEFEKINSSITTVINTAKIGTEEENKSAVNRLQPPKIYGEKIPNKTEDTKVKELSMQFETAKSHKVKKTDEDVTNFSRSSLKKRNQEN